MLNNQTIDAIYKLEARAYNCHNDDLTRSYLRILFNLDTVERAAAGKLMRSLGLI